MKPIPIFLRCAALSALAAVGAIAAPPGTNQETNLKPAVIPLIVMENVPLTDAIKNLARQAGINFILDPRVPGSSVGPGRRIRQQLINGRWENVTAEQALEFVLKSNNLVMVDNPATTVARIAPANLGIKPVPADQVGPDRIGVRPDIQVIDLPFDKAITTIAEQAQLSVSLDTFLSAGDLDLSARVTFIWKDLTRRQALAAVLDNYELVMDENRTDGTAVIRLAHSESRVIPLIKLDDVSLNDALKNLARVAKVNYILDSRVPGSDIGPGRRLKEPVITARWEDVTARQALDDVLKSNRLVLVPNRVTTIARIVPANATVNPAPPGEGAADTGEVIPLIVADQVPLADLLKEIAKQAKLQVTLSSEITSPPPEFYGTISVRWENVTARQALAALVDNFGLVMIEDPASSSAVIKLKPREK